MGFQSAINRATGSVMGAIAAAKVAGTHKQGQESMQEMQNEKLKNMKLANKQLRLDNRRKLAMARMEELKLAKAQQQADLKEKKNNLGGNING